MNVYIYVMDGAYGIGFEVAKAASREEADTFVSESARGYSNEVVVVTPETPAGLVHTEFPTGG